jgi:Ca2+-binding RTX toxin-like protein
LVEVQLFSPKRGVEEMSVSVESLEGRRLLSSVTFTNGVLKVLGDNNVNDVISLSLSGNGENVIATINGDASDPFAKADITRIQVKGRSGNDEFSIDETNGKLRPITIIVYGGLGNDEINGGSDKIKVFGEDGHDRIVARGYLDGGDGNDTIYGSNATDYIFGGNGHDHLDGRSGKDYVFGDGGNDYLRGGKGNDYLFGGKGEDTLEGFEGNDRIYGNGGFDRISGGDDDDTLYGGSKDDLINGDGGTDVKEYGEYKKLDSLIEKLIARSKAFL